MWADLGWLSSLEFMNFSKVKLCTRSKCITLIEILGGPSMMLGQNLTDSLPASCVAPAATACWTSQPGYFKIQHLLSQQVAKNHIIDGPPCSSPYILIYKNFGYGRILDRQSDSESDKLTQDWKMQTCQSPLGSYIVELEFQILSSPAAAIAKRRHRCRAPAPPSAANSPPSPPLLHNAAPHSSKVWVCLGQVLPNYLEMKANAHLNVWLEVKWLQHGDIAVFNFVPTRLCYVIYYHGYKKYPYYKYILPNHLDMKVKAL